MRHECKQMGKVICSTPFGGPEVYRSSFQVQNSPSSALEEGFGTVQTVGPCGTIGGGGVRAPISHLCKR